MKAALDPFRSQLENSPSSWQAVGSCQSRWRRSQRWDVFVFSQCSDVFFRAATDPLLRFGLRGETIGTLQPRAQAGGNK